MSIPYVKFFRGTPEAFNNLVIKDADTLYFIAASNESTGKLYLGDKLISDNINSITDLEDVLLSNLTEDQLLIFNGEKWVNKSIFDAIGVMIGASETEQGSIGLVPAPGEGMQDAFLRGDGEWVKIEPNLTADEKSISIKNKVIILKDFGVKYYKFVAATGSEETGDYVAAHYEAQLVDENNPWVEGLEPKVVEESGELVLGWFQPNSSTIEGVTDQILILQNKIDDLSVKVEDKAGISTVYTKEETTNLINSAITEADHLTRKVFASLEEAETFAIVEGEDAIKYIYMVLNSDSIDENNKYDEYLYENGKLELVGNWAVNLDGYATKEDLQSKVDVEEGKSLVSDTEITKLVTVKENAEPNYITKVNAEEFKVEDGSLSIVSIVPSKILGLDELLNNKANKAEFEVLSNNLGEISTKVSNIEEQLKEFVTLDTYNNDIAEIKDAITWKSI